MFTGNVAVLLILAFVTLAVAVFLLIYGIYVAITEKDAVFCGGMVFVFLLLSSLSAFVYTRQILITKEQWDQMKQGQTIVTQPSEPVPEEDIDIPF